MDDLHRKVLRQNRTKFIENIAKPLDVNELLFEYGIFTEGMKQEVEVMFVACLTPLKKHQCLVLSLLDCQVNFIFKVKLVTM